MGPLGIGIGIYLGMRGAGGVAAYTPALKFNDKRNSQYLPLVAAMTRRA